MNGLCKGTPGLPGLLKLVLDGEAFKEPVLRSRRSVALRLPKPDPNVDRLFL